MEYRKRKGSDTWHWCTNCSQWPTSDYDSQNVLAGRRPSSGELHEECLSKEKDQTCRGRG